MDFKYSKRLYRQKLVACQSLILGLAVLALQDRLQRCWRCGLKSGDSSYETKKQISLLKSFQDASRVDGRLRDQD